MAKASSPAVEIEVDDKVVRVSNPDRVYFPERGWTKLDLVDYYLAVGDGIEAGDFEVLADEISHQAKAAPGLPIEAVYSQLAVQPV